MMTKQEIRAVALAQSALEFGCAPEDFCKSQHHFTISQEREGARSYLPLPFDCDLVTYGSNVVAQTSPELAAPVREYLAHHDLEHCMETPSLYALNELLAPYGKQVCFMAEYFLPDPQRLQALPCPYPMKVLQPADFAPYYSEQWHNALCRARKHLDVLAVGAFDGEELVGLAGCSADCETMYQIGIDVHPDYRQQGIAAALTSRLALEIFALGKVPFYCAAWCNVKSVRNAFRCGFEPAWMEVTARDIGFVQKMLHPEP